MHQEIENIEYTTYTYKNTFHTIYYTVCAHKNTKNKSWKHSKVLLIIMRQGFFVFDYEKFIYIYFYTYKSCYAKREEKFPIKLNSIFLLLLLLLCAFCAKLREKLRIKLFISINKKILHNKKCNQKFNYKLIYIYKFNFI